MSDEGSNSNAEIKTPREVSFADAKKELQEEVRRSLVRDASAMLKTTAGQLLVSDSEAMLGRLLVNSNSVENFGVHESKKPFVSHLSHDLSAKQFTIAPSTCGKQTTVLAGQAKERLLKEKRIEMLHKPDLNKSSCNHCISKAISKHEKAMERMALSSLQSASGATTKASALNHAITEFLSVAPSEGANLPYTFSVD